jgi:hypothetical protein
MQLGFAVHAESFGSEFPEPVCCGDTSIHEEVAVGNERTFRWLERAAAGFADLFVDDAFDEGCHQLFVLPGEAQRSGENDHWAPRRVGNGQPRMVKVGA